MVHGPDASGGEVLPDLLYMHYVSPLALLLSLPLEHVAAAKHVFYARPVR